MAVRINRGERETPFLSNIVKGSALQETPNGIARDTDNTEGQPTGFINNNTPSPFIETPMPEAETWGGNRSGE